jgi:hypothetical protein
VRSSDSQTPRLSGEQIKLHKASTSSNIKAFTQNSETIAYVTAIHQITTNQAIRRLTEAETEKAFEHQLT